MIASVSYNTGGSAGPYTITFPYLQQADVDVYLDGVITTAYTFPSATTITLNSAPSATVIEIRRATTNTPLVDFTDPGTLTATDLDTATLQAIYIAQEAKDNSDRLFEEQEGLFPPEAADAGKFLKVLGEDDMDWTAIVRTDISDSTAAGRSVMGVASNAALLTQIGGAAAVHVHSGADLTSGKVPAARLEHVVKVFNIVDYGADPSGSAVSTTNVQTAINAAQVSGGIVYVPAGVYLVGPLDLTDCDKSVIIEGEGVNASRFMPDPAVTWTTKHMFDLSASLQVTLKHFQIGAFNQTPVPVSAILLAQKSGSNVSNQIHMEGLYVTGKYTVAPLAVYGVPSWDAVNCDFYNYKTGAGTHCAAYITSTNVRSLASEFVTIATGNNVASDITFTACEFHKFAGAGADGGVIDFEGTFTKDIRFIGGNCTGGAQNYIVTAGQVDRIVFLGTTFETESEAVTPTNLLAIAADGSADIRFLNCLAICTTFIGGAGALDSKGSGIPLYGHISAGATVAAGATTYMGPQGNSATEANESFLAPFDGVLTSLQCSSPGSPGQTPGFTWTVMVGGVASALTTVISGGAVSGTDLTHYVNVSRGDLISFRLVTHASANVVGGHRAVVEITPRPVSVY